MSWRYRSGSWVAAAVVMAVMLLIAPTAMADELEEKEERVEELREQLESLEAQASDDVAPEEFETAFQWLEEAEQFIEEGASRGVEQRVRRADHMVDMVRALVETRRIEHSIEDQRNAYETSVEQLENLEDEIEDLEQRRAERREELEQIRQDIEEMGEE